MASKADRTIPDLANATPGFLVDEIASMRVQAARLKFLDGVFKQALEARVTPEQLNGSQLVQGERFVGHYEQKSTVRVDADKVREYFKDDPEGYASVCSESSFTQLNTNAKEHPGI